MIEINSAIPVGIFQTHRGGDIRGSSFSSTVDLGKSKGYAPVCHTGNLIFVHNDFLHQLNLPKEEIDYPELIFDYSWKKITYGDPISITLRKWESFLRKMMTIIRR